MRRNLTSKNTSAKNLRVTATECAKIQCINFLGMVWVLPFQSILDTVVRVVRESTV